jgi:hypothetical protein
MVMVLLRSRDRFAFSVRVFLVFVKGYSLSQPSATRWFLLKLVRSIPATNRCRGKEPESQSCAHLLPEAVSGAAAARVRAVGGAIAQAARILVVSLETTIPKR